MDGGVRWAYYECELEVSAALLWYVRTYIGGWWQASKVLWASLLYGPVGTLYIHGFTDEGSHPFDTASFRIPAQALPSGVKVNPLLIWWEWMAFEPAGFKFGWF